MRSKSDVMVSSSRADPDAACCCHKSPPNMGGTARRSSTTPARKRACLPARGKTARASACSKRSSSVNATAPARGSSRMDNVCHTLVGAAFGEAGLKHRTRFGAAALMISANIPDVDVFVFLTGASPVAFRRGITHGIVAPLLLPVLLTAIFVLVARLRPRPPSDDGPPLRPGGLLLPALSGVYSHVSLDWLNNYGVRVLTPFSWQWFYGDSVFIVDPLLWLVVRVCAVHVRRHVAPRPARGALAFAACYILVMVMSARAARGIVERVWRETRGVAPVALMVGPI